MSLKGSYPETPRDVSDLTQTTLYPAQGSVVTHRTAECVPGTSITLAELGEDELLKGGNCGLKDSQPQQEGLVLWGLELCIQKTLKTWWPMGRAVGRAVGVPSPRVASSLGLLSGHTLH